MYEWTTNNANAMNEDAYQRLWQDKTKYALCCTPNLPSWFRLMFHHKYYVALHSYIMMGSKYFSYQSLPQALEDWLCWQVSQGGPYYLNL